MFTQSRSEWCISRQRAWGVPIPVLYDAESDVPLLSETSIEHIIGIVREHGSDGWWKVDERELVAPQYRNNGMPNSFFSFSCIQSKVLHLLYIGRAYRRGTDTMDVWFDSGVSWTLINEKFNR